MDQDQRASTGCSDSSSSNETSQCAESSEASTSPRCSQRQRSTGADSVHQNLAWEGDSSGTERSESEQSSQHAVEPSEEDGQGDDVASELSRSVDSAEPWVFPGREFEIDMIEVAVKRGHPCTASQQAPPRLIMGDGRWRSTLVTLTVEGAAGAACHYFNSDLWRYGGRASLLLHPGWHEADSIDLKVSHGHIMVEVSFHEGQTRRSTTWAWSSDKKGIFRVQPEHIHVVEMVCCYLNSARGHAPRYPVYDLFGLPHRSPRVSPGGLSRCLQESFVSFSNMDKYFDWCELPTERMADTAAVVEALTRVHGVAMEMVGVAEVLREENCVATAVSQTGLIEGVSVRLPSAWDACEGDPCLCGDSVMVLDTMQEPPEVRELEPGEEYLAISYVWAQHDQSSLLSYIERATEETGVYSVWVDRLCINQRCSQHKARQIPRMREVYQEGYATVALVPDITETLPTIFDTPTAIVPLDSVRAAEPFITQMKACAWRTRCWTWQEGLLGRRGCYVTKTQVLPARAVTDFLVELPPPYSDETEAGIGAGLMGSLGVHPLRCRIETWYQELSIGDLLDAGDQELMQYWLMPQVKSLGEALHLTRDRAASRPEDEIYSVLGMVPRGEELPVVYGESRNAILGRAVNGGLLGAEVLDTESVSSRAGESWAARDDTSQHIGQTYRLQRRVPGSAQIDDRGLKYQFHRVEGVTEAYLDGPNYMLKLANSSEREIYFRMKTTGANELRALVTRSGVDQVLLLETDTIFYSPRALLVSGTGGHVVRVATGTITIDSYTKVETQLVWRVVG